MQSIHHEVSSAKDSLKALQSNLDDYLNQRLSFGDLRRRWIAALSDNPNLRAAALRLLYKRPLSAHLEDGKILSLKRIAEAALDEDPDDWTEELQGHIQTVPTPLPEAAKTDANRRVAEQPKRSQAPVRLPPANEPKRTVRPGLRADRLPEELAPGHVLMQRFVLEEALGRGGSGVVYSARDRMRKRAHAATDQIALKILRRDLGADQRRADALQDEALLTQSLSHPNIVRVFDYYEDGDTRFLTMELLRGELLKSLLSRSRPGAVPAGRAFKIIDGMCQGLAYAHAKGCVHADFKPGNVVLTDAGEVKILDFGLAHAAPSGTQFGERSADSGITASRANTPAYASCNRLEGGAPVFSDDVYSLSCVIYEMLAGYHPYQRQLATDARKSGVKPDRIDGLTDLQWRTLAAGLRLSSTSTGGAPEVHDLLTAFRSQAAPAPMPSPAAKNPPAGRARSRSWGLAAVFAAFLLGAGLVLVMAALGISPADSRHARSLGESAIVQSVRSKLGVPDVATDTPGTDSVLAAPPEVRDDSSEKIADSAAAPMPQVSESVAGENDTPEPTSSVGVFPDLSAEVRTRPEAEQPLVEAEQPLVASLSPAAIEEPVAASVDVPAFQLSSSVYSINEGGTALAVEVVRQGNVSVPTYIKLTTRPGTARANLDFVPLESSFLGFKAGEASKTIFIPIIADAVEEGDELFEIELTTTNAQMILTEPSSATVIIKDDDA